MVVLLPPSRLDGGVCKTPIVLRGEDATVGVDRRPRELGVAVGRWCFSVDDERRRPFGDACPLELRLIQTVTCSAYARNQGCKPDMMKERGGVRSRWTCWRPCAPLAGVAWAEAVVMFHY